MSAQMVLVVVIVAACAVHAAVTFAPSALRRRAASMLMRLPALRGSARLARAASAGGGCGCAGCDRAQPPATPHKVIVLHAVRSEPGKARNR